MNHATAKNLNAINRDFYREHAASFSDKRSRPWPGWNGLLPRLRADATADEPLRVLDVGCGNGRFAAFLDRELERRVVYLGLDASASLLAEAQRRVPNSVSARFVCADLLDPAPPLPAERFECVAAFGLLHHLPGRDRREALMAALASRLAPRGILVLSFWNFGSHARFAQRHVPWETYNREAKRPIDLAQLEPGDALLRWGDDPGAWRYCHHSDAAERERLIAATGLVEIERFEAERGLNEYRVLALPVSPT